MKGKTFIISLGGSLIVPPEGINHKLLKNFKKLILEQIKKGNKFFLITGGGTTCRDYINGALKITKIKDDDLDWLGIHSSRLNAHLIRTIFRETAHREIIKNPTHLMHTDKKIIIGGGWKPGWSTDYVATKVAEEYEVETVINLSNIDYAYTKDPNEYSDAEKIIETNWEDFRKIVGNKWIPGMNAPFDPIASKKADHLGLTVHIMNGNKLKNLEKCLNGEKFAGTTIKN